MKRAYATSSTCFSCSICAQEFPVNRIVDIFEHMKDHLHISACMILKYPDCLYGDCRSQAVGTFWENMPLL